MGKTTSEKIPPAERDTDPLKVNITKMLASPPPNMWILPTTVLVKKT